ncbi:MAG: PIG-L deacetylase family protein [Terriglobia bacterium]
MRELTRRELLNRGTGLACAAAVALPLAGAAETGQGGGVTPVRKPKVVVAGAHPDDPESGCGGTIARYSDLGHEVVVLYLTRGERGIKGKSYDEAGRIRTAEAQKACEILKAHPVFAGQVNGMVEVNYARYDEFRKVLEAEKPDLVYTQWPIDTHEDHRATSLLTYDAWLRGGKKFALYYYEVMTGEQTSHFWPTHYVDITATEARKRQACYTHSSQDPDGFYPIHDEMNRFRGHECGCHFAEAFIRHVQSPDDSLPEAG